MSDPANERLDDLMDRYVFGLLDDTTARRTRSRIAEDPQWQLAYAAAVKRKAALMEAVRAGGEPAGLPAAGEVLAAARAAEARARRTRRIVRGSLVGVAAAAALVIAAAWVRVALIRPPDRNLRLIGQTTLLADSQAALLATVTDLAGRPTAGVPVRLELTGPGGKVLPLARWTTDAAGVAHGPVPVPDWPAGQYSLIASAGKRPVTTLSVPITIRRARQVYLATDKPIYQPGQTVHMRTLVLRKPAGKPDAGGAAAFTVTDPAGNVIFSQPATLSGFGIASADLPTDELITPGRYIVKVAAGSDESAQVIDIFHYRLPAFAVKVTLDRSYYLAGETVTGGVEVRYHFGQAVGGATVELLLSARETGADSTIAAATVVTDALGKARLSLPLPETLFGSARTQGDAHLRLAAKATDSAGQQNTAYHTVVVAREAIRLAAAVENGSPTPGVETRLFVVATYPDGRRMPGIIDLEGLGVSQRTDAAGAAVFASAHFPSPLRITARDPRGRTGRLDLSLTAAADAFVLRTDKPIYTAGETAAVQVLGGPDGEVFLDVIKDRQTLLTRALTVANGRAELALDIPPALAGTLHLHAYRLNASGEWAGRDLLVVVRPADRLRVAVARDRDTSYRPGEDARLSFTVTDPAGKAVPAALSLAAVDEAVFSVAQAAPGLEETLAGLEADLLAPAVEAHGWSLAALDQSQDYARAVLASAVGRVKSESSRLRELERAGLIVPGMFRDLTPAEVRRTLQRNPSLRAELGPQLVAELTGGREGVHSLDRDSEWQEQAAFRQRRSAAKDELGTVAFVAALAGAAALVALAFIWAGGAKPISETRPVVPPLLGSLIIVVVILLLLAATIVPTLSRARALAKRVPCQASLRSLWMADEMLRAERGGEAPAGQQTDTAAGGPRVRTYFPETMLWRPEVITDESGRAELTVPLADSITTWRLGGSAVGMAGQLGTVEASIRVFQPFFVDIDAPSTLTAGDEVEVPVIVYNYTRNVLRVALEARGKGGLTLLGGHKQDVRLTASQVQRFSVRVRADAAGEGELTVEARADSVADAIRRPVRIAPPGMPQARAVNGPVAEGDQTIALDIPAEAAANSVAVQLKLYPGTFSQLIDGLEGIFRMPSGCFEQTSSTTYPNVMALAYMKAAGVGSPEVRARAVNYIHLGYQRLISFEVPGGGFDWFGGPPASVILTAYGLMEFADMARVHAVDPRLLKRTADWLAGRQDGSGAWRMERGCFHEPFTGRDAGELAATAYVTWAVAGYDPAHPAARRGAAYLAERVGQAQDPRTLALCANALLAADAGDPAGRATAGRLAGMARATEGGQSYWPGGGYRGWTADVEATATAALALARLAEHRPLAARALKWLAQRRDPAGTWGSTQATVLSLKALLAAAGAPVKRDRPATVAVYLSGEDRPLGLLTIRPEASDAVHTLRLPGLTAPGRHDLRLNARSAEGMAWQFVVRYHSLVSDPAPPKPAGLEVKVNYDRTTLRPGGAVAVRAVVTNHTPAQADMLLVDIGTPPGFSVDPSGLDRLREAGAIQRYTLTARGVIVYLRSLPARGSAEITYRMTARMALRAVAAPTRAYSYYQPDQAAAAAPANFVVE